MADCALRRTIAAHRLWQLIVSQGEIEFLCMSAAELIQELKTMPDTEREKIFASLAENPEWREDILDLMTIADRRSEPTRVIDDVFKDLKIDA